MITIDGRTYNVPGVYGAIEVLNLGSIALPKFNGLVVIGNARQGIPYSAGAGQEVIQGFTSVANARKLFGSCDLTKAMGEAKLGGAGVIFALTSAKLTRATIKVEDSAAEILFNLKPTLYGAPGNDIHVNIEYSEDAAVSDITDSDGTLTITTLAAHGLAVGDDVLIHGVVGMTSVNKVPLVVTSVPTATTFTVVHDVGVETYSEGGTVSKYIVAEIIPVKTAKFLTKDVSSAINVVEIDDTTGLYENDPVYLVDNDTAYVSAVLEDIDHENKKIKLSTTVDGLTQDEYARMFVQDVENSKYERFDVGSPTLLNDIINWFIQSGVLTAEKLEAYEGNVYDLAAVDDFIGNLADSPSDRGESPIPTEIEGGDWDELADSLPQLFEEFTNFTRARIRIINLVTPNSRLHAKYLAIAKTLRSNPIQYSVQIVSGVNKGDINLPKTSLDHPIKRAKALNDDDFILCGMGYDDKDAYLSYAPQFAGRMSAYSVKRNLTNDNVLCSKVEKFFGGYNQEVETSMFLANGVNIIKTGKYGFATVQGINTYQKQNNIWNEDDKKTYLIQQRQIVDFVYEGYKEQMEEGVGADDFDEVKATAKGLAILDEYLSGGFITKRKISEAYRKGNAIYTHPEIVPLPATDFVGFILKVVIEN